MYVCIYVPPLDFTLCKSHPLLFNFNTMVIYTPLDLPGRSIIGIQYIWVKLIVIQASRFGRIKDSAAQTKSKKGTFTKQGTSDILGKTSVWYHTFNFNLISKINFIFLLLFEIWIFIYKTFSSSSGSVILRNRPLRFPFLWFWIWQAAENAEFFVGLKISLKLHGGKIRH